jgi:hypothetical protein
MRMILIGFVAQKVASTFSSPFPEVIQSITLPVQLHSLQKRAQNIIRIRRLGLFFLITRG